MHIPFCHRRCFYCDFAILPMGDKAHKKNSPENDLVKSYLKALHKEIELVNDVEPLSTLYIGGGTPSILEIDEISSLLEHIEKKFCFQPGIEITIEIDPASFNFSYLTNLLTLGINRFSLGGQSFDNETLRKIGRRHNQTNLINSCAWLDELLKKKQIKSWSLDLIQNLPDSKLHFWEEQINQAINCNPPHLSIYDLTIEPGTKFFYRNKYGKLHLPDDDCAADINRLTSAMLENVGYARYEISNYAKPGFTSRHNRVYWSGSGWWAFGMGSTSSPWGIRFSRPKQIDKYIDWVDQQSEKGIHFSLLKKNQKPIPFDDQIIVGIRRREGVNLDQLADNSGWPEIYRKKYLERLMERWKVFFDSGILKMEGNRAKLKNPEGMDICNQVLVEMFIWWDELPKEIFDLSNPSNDL